MRLCGFYHTAANYETECKKMKIYFTKAVAFILCAAMLVCLMPASVCAAQDKQLKFNSDGSFKIVVFADCQDSYPPRVAMIEEMNRALDELKPDLVVFTGDNVGAIFGKPLAKVSISAVLEPVVSRGIPFAYTFGNHDAEHVDKEYQMSIYESFDGCMTYDAVPELTGAGTCSLPIYSSDGSGRVAFNLWMIDSNMYDENDEYDNVHQDQIAWYKQTSDALKQANGGEPMPSLVFQHIPVPEIFELLVPGDEIKKCGYKVKLELDPEKATGHIGEAPCPPAVNSGEFDAFVSQGDVIGIVTGHDHVNSFVGTYKGIDFIQTSGIGFSTYGDEQRGCRLITLNEGNPRSYETETYDFAHFFGDDYYAGYYYTYYGSFIANFVPDFINNMLDDYMRSDKGPAAYERMKKLFSLFE